ncbi:MAG: hypothetical protein R3B13_27480 [Polyangiaceae bacterium]
MTKSPKDIGASVRARLLRLARERGEDFQLVLTRYANERLLYRLASSEHASRFVLKGAALPRRAACRDGAGSAGTTMNSLVREASATASAPAATCDHDKQAL